MLETLQAELRQIDQNEHQRKTAMNEEPNNLAFNVSES
jgi:hypothetical protein